MINVKCNDISSVIPGCNEFLSHLPECFEFYSFKPSPEEDPIPSDTNLYPDPEDPRNIWGIVEEPVSLDPLDLTEYGITQIHGIATAGWSIIVSGIHTAPEYPLGRAALMRIETLPLAGGGISTVGISQLNFVGSSTRLGSISVYDCTDYGTTIYVKKGGLNSGGEYYDENFNSIAFRYDSPYNTDPFISETTNNTSIIYQNYNYTWHEPKVWYETYPPTDPPPVIDCSFPSAGFCGQAGVICEGDPYETTSQTARYVERDIFSGDDLLIDEKTTRSLALKIDDATKLIGTGSICNAEGQTWEYGDMVGFFRRDGDLVDFITSYEGKYWLSIEYQRDEIALNRRVGQHISNKYYQGRTVATRFPIDEESDNFIDISHIFHEPISSRISTHKYQKDATFVSWGWAGEMIYVKRDGTSGGREDGGIDWALADGAMLKVTGDNTIEQIRLT